MEHEGSTYQVTRIRQRAFFSKGNFGKVTIDDLLFNTYNPTKLAFYKENGSGTADKSNPYLENMGNGKGILDVVNDYFIFFRGIAIIFYLILYRNNIL